MSTFDFIFLFLEYMDTRFKFQRKDSLYYTSEGKRFVTDVGYAHDAVEIMRQELKEMKDRCDLK